MKLSETLQELRRAHGLTQEELAARLFVSRTAVSKWESGRGYPNLASLLDLAALFGVTVDALLSGGELVTAATAEQRMREGRTRARLLGALDLLLTVLFFLPILAERGGAALTTASLLSLSAPPYLRVLYLLLVGGSVALGALLFSLSRLRLAWTWGCRLSLLASALGALLFSVGLQPYAAALCLLLLSVKGLILLPSEGRRHR